jgi:hypothetical protein
MIISSELDRKSLVYCLLVTEAVWEKYVKENIWTQGEIETDRQITGGWRKLHSRKIQQTN